MGHSPLFRFGDFTLDPLRHALRRGAQAVPLPESAMAVLETLLAKAPETVDRATLMDIAWPDTAVVPDNLVQAIHVIRMALGGDAREPRFVQTVHRRGYRFVAPVTVIDFEEDFGDLKAPPLLESATSKRTRFHRIFPVVLLVALVVAAGLVGFWTTRKARRASTRTIRSLAVLPMTNLSGDPDQEFFADGMTDALITELARIETLDVISRTSVMKFKDSRESVPDIARKLGVDAIVEGTVTRGSGRIRVIAQLVDAGDHHIWGENYESRDQDILRLQRDMAEAIAREIGARVQGRRSGERPPEVNPAAHEAFLRGSYVLKKRKKESFFRAQEYFEQAIALDPNYAQAYAGLAHTFNLMANYGFAPSPPARSSARLMAKKALELDSDLAEAHLALAVIASEYDWNFDEAEAEFAIALSLRKSSPEIHAHHAQLLEARGELSRALEESRYAQRLDPLSEIINANTGWFLFLDGQEDAAEEQFLALLKFSPNFPVGYYYLGRMYDSQGRFEEAIPALEKARVLSEGSSYAEAALAHALAGAGQRTRAEAILEDLLRRQSLAYVSPVGLAVASIGLGRVDEGFQFLEQAFEERKGWLLELRVEPVMDALREDPRYLDLVRRIGLPPISGDSRGRDSDASDSD